MTGYQEILTDPSYSGQLVCFTAPMVGNYGVAAGRSESAAVHATGVLMREARGPEWTDWLRDRGRSEEHTSELQSRSDLVCRLLLPRPPSSPLFPYTTLFRSMTGYQEILTDPSYSGQLVCFTAPMVGNYGVAAGRSESAAVHATGVLMREARGPEWTDWLRDRG